MRGERDVRIALVVLAAGALAAITACQQPQGGGGGGSKGSSGSSGSSGSGGSGAVTSGSSTADTSSESKADVLGGLSQALKTHDDSKKVTSLKDERDLGETVALQAYATPDFGVPIHNKKVMRFVNTLATVIGRFSDRPLIPYFVAVIDSPKINAFATPGGYIFITRGAIESMGSEAELACVVGHEIAHITERHALDTLKRTQSAAGYGKAFATATGADADALDKMVKDCCNQLLNKAFDKDKETKADLRGVEFAFRAGYDPRAMLTFLDRLESKPNLLAPGLADHPPAKERKKELNKLFATRLHPEKSTGLVVDTARFANLKKWLAEPAEPWPAESPAPATPGGKK